MDKVLINNQIVIMRKFVKQAKIRAINNYTKEIRLLQNRKGDDNETSKHKRKAERLLSKVAILRKIQPDTISRKALSKEKDWKDVLKEKNIPLEDQCYAMLANYGPVQSEVEKFHKKHWDLVPKITALFKSWEEKSKNPMIKQERKKAKELRKSLKAANVKLGKDNSNATPIGPLNKNNTDKIISKTEIPKNIHEKEKNCDVLIETSDNMNEDLNKKSIQNDTMPLTLLNVGIEEATDNENREINESKNSPRKAPTNKYLKKKINMEDNKNNSIATASKEELEENLLKPMANSDVEENNFESDSGANSLVSESEAEASSLDNDSEDGAISEEESIEERLESETEKITEHTIELKKAGKATMKDKKTNINEKRKYSFNAKANSANNPNTNTLKAVTMLNLNELEGLDEIPIEKTDIIDEEAGEKKRKKDSFFLGKGGEAVSESEDSDYLGQEQDELDFKKRKFNNFERKSSDGDFFKKRNFTGHPPHHQKPGFKGNDIQRNKRNTNFEDKSNSFQNRGRPSFEFQNDKRFKSMDKDQLKNKRESKFFGNQPSTKKQNFHQEQGNKAHFQNDKLSSSLKKSNSDDKPLHPSWEAKKKLKESAKAKFQGKRIVFGD